MHVSQRFEGSLDVFALERADFAEFKADLVCEGLAICAAHSLAVVEIDLVSDNDA